MIFVFIGIVILVIGLIFSLNACEPVPGIIGGVLGVALIVCSFFAVIPSGHTGVVSTFGKISDNVLQEGLQTKLPWQSVKVMDNRVVKLEVQTQAFSSDLQTVDVNIAVNYRVDKSMSYYIIKNVGTSFENVLITPSVNEVLKSIIAQYTAEQSISNRPAISLNLLDELNSKLNKSGIFVEEINIIDFDFSETYIAAIEAKQVAEQEKLKAQIEQDQLTMETQASADRAVIEAEAALEVAKIEADAAEYAGAKEAAKNAAIANSLTNELIDYYYVQQWDGKLPTTVMSNDTVPLLNVDAAREEE